MCIFDIFDFFGTSYPVMLAQHKKTNALPYYFKGLRYHAGASK